jgi:DNA-binding MarR family transcriptional regulator
LGRDDAGSIEIAIRMTEPSQKSRRRDATTDATTPWDGQLRLGALSNAIGFHLRLAQEASFQAFARHVDKIDLRPGRFAILALIDENPGLSQTSLGRASGRDKSSLTPALNDLVRRGLVLRQRLPHDQRSYALSLTDAGKALLEDLLVHARDHDRELDQIIGNANKAEFIRLLRRITMALDRGG